MDLFRKIWTENGTTVRIIFICVSVFFVEASIDLFAGISAGESFRTLLSLPFSLTNFLHQPWSIITFTFGHKNVFHLLNNMVFLWIFGSIYELYQGQKNYWTIFLLGSVFGAIMAITLSYLFPALPFGNYLLGASAGVMAIVFAATFLHPNHEVNLLLIGRVQIKWIAFFAFLMDYAEIRLGNSGGLVAHLGGAFFGALSILSMRNGFSIFFYLDKLKNIFSRNKLKTVHTDPLVKQSTHKDQHKLDEILDKINKSGYESLSKNEKQFLFMFSKNEKQ